MSIITFLFKGGEVPIQCTPKEKLVTIIQRFCQKAEVNRNNVIFLFNGGILDEYITEEKIPKNEQNKKFITVDYNINDDDQNDIIIKSHDIICPKCKECASISINDDYKISLSNCKNGHKIENILISEFQKTQDINISKIICDRCKNKNMGEVFNQEFYRCINCKMNLCPLCKKEHNLNHNMIIYQNKFYICEEHGEPFISFCNECNKNLCFTCEEKHSNHQITDFKKLRKNKNDLEKELNIFKGYLDKIKKIAEDDTRIVLHLHPALAPYKVAVLPLSKKLSEKAVELRDTLSKSFMVDYDETGSIGKRYRREDEIGTPYCVTVDFDTLEDNQVTIRDRDTMEQIRIPIDEVENWVKQKIEF